MSSPVVSEANPFGGPFNGQLGRTALVNELLAALSFRAVVETGTFTGTTTEYLLSQTSIPVHSVEIDPERSSATRQRLAQYKDRAFLVCGDSRELLQQLASNAQFPQDSVFFYLDAHWKEDLPLKDEVRLILSRWGNSVIMIDDFQVPDDPGYG